MSSTCLLLESHNYRVATLPRLIRLMQGFTRFLWGIARALHTAPSGEMRRNFISPDDQLNGKSHID
ncbi:hypothetical protein EEN27_10475 [Salmonella enterica]|uniref:Uncharacterized protein n=5 Tax=Salmonella enterica TaxID=28901 RepID=A0A5V7HAM0_SALET|nr:hypothetical protein SEECH997_001910 [Salmonella enterica subsp. enterica serovar Chester str. ATCC 11997]EAA1200900.1 hypothetical protein [Salmonella enterica subsp. enterica serovar Brandenburg]EAA3497365.1 hypothetical protein [Salmonella enterica subsp. enterica serovar Chester]EAA6946456.1 hypothetical protein [Salmonella enterica subsp. enterica serovar Javiana]EAA8405439.1 hypothetical protein [Salmonella enterica]EAW1144732.1 hypothetical protein [Salmonella enterica subsp. enteric